MWASMTLLVKVVVLILFVLSIYSFGVMIDRALSTARRASSSVSSCSRLPRPKDGKLDESHRHCERNKKSHIAKVVATGLSEFQSGLTASFGLRCH